MGLFYVDTEERERRVRECERERQLECCYVVLWNQMGMGSEEGALPKPLVHIPSYSQVLEDSRPQPPPSLFRASSQSSSVANPNLSSRSDSPAAAAVHVGSVSDDITTGIQASAAPRLSENRVPFTEASSFTEAFSFLRSTEFYSPPPPPPPPAAPSPPAPASGLGSGPRSSWSNGNPLAANQQRYVPQ